MASLERRLVRDGDTPMAVNAAGEREYRQEVLCRVTSKFSVLEALANCEIGNTIGIGTVFVDVDEAYTRGAIRRALQDHSFSVIYGHGEGMDAVRMPAPALFQWAEYERIDWSAVLAGRHGASSYCVRKGLSRKAQLAYYTKRHINKHPESLLRTCLPTAVVIDTWPVWDTKSASSQGLADIIVQNRTSGNIDRRSILQQCLDEAHSAMASAEACFATSHDGNCSSPPVWILKGSTTNKGAGIFLVHLYEQLVDVCWSESDIREWVLQRYISNPLLLDGRKFHVRAYALAVGDLRVYLNCESLALCAGTPFYPDDTSNLLSHITNTAYQDLDPNYREKDCVLLWAQTSNIPRILVQSGTVSSIDQAQQCLAKVQRDMHDITAELFRAYDSEFAVFSPLDHCFEHYGLDFMVDSNWNVYLLEVNPGPDFKQTGAALRCVIDRLMLSTVKVVFANASCAGSTFPDQCGSLDLVYHRQASKNRGNIHMKVQ